MADKFATLEEYIASFPEDTQEVLEGVRRAIHGVIPGAGEKISYNLAAVTLEGKAIVYFAGWKSHISLYPLPELDEAMAERMKPYRSGAGTAKFPLAQPIPYDLIADLARLLAEQHSP